MLANKTEARQWTCAEWPGKCWKCLLQKGDSLLYVCSSIYTHLIFGVPHMVHLYKEGHICSLPSWENKYPQENNAIWGYHAARIGTFLLTFRENVKVPPKVVPKRRYQIITTRFVIIHKSAVFIYFAYKACNHAKYIQFQKKKSNYGFEPNNIFV